MNDFNKRTDTLLYKNISHTLFSKGLMFLWCVRDGWRDIYSERALLPISPSESRGGANARTPLQARQRRLWSAVCPSLDCDSLHSVKIWSRGSHRVVFFRLHTCFTRPPRFASHIPVYSSRRHQERTENTWHMLYNKNTWRQGLCIWGTIKVFCGSCILYWNILKCVSDSLSPPPFTCYLIVCRGCKGIKHRRKKRQGYF